MRTILKFNTIFVFLITFIFYFYYQRLHPLFGDEFNILVQAQRVIEGEVPYRDFFQFITPGSIYLVAGWFKLFGNSIGSIRLLTALQGSMILTFTYCIATHLIRSRIVQLITLLLSLYFTLVFWPFISHHWLSTMCVLIALWNFMNFLKNRKHIVFFSTGFISGITYLFLQSKGAMILLTFMLFIIIDLKFRRGDLSNTRGGHLFIYLLSLLSGFLLPLGMLVLYLSLNNALDEFIEYTVGFIFGPYQRFNAYPNYFYAGNYGIYRVVSQNSFPLNLVRSRDFLMIGYVPPVIIGLGIYSTLVEWFKCGKREFLLPTLTATAMFCSVLYRADIVHLTTVWQFFAILLGLLFDRWLCLTAGILNLRRFFLRSILVFFLFYGIHSIYKSIRFASSFRAELVTDIGSIYLSEENIRDFYKSALDFIKNETGDAKIFVYNWSSFLYMLTSKRNPTSFDSIIPGYNTDKHLQLLVEELEKNRVEYIVYDGVDEGLARDPDLFMYPSARVNLKNPLSEYIGSKFILLKTLSYDESTFFRIYKRR